MYALYFYIIYFAIATYQYTDYFIICLEEQCFNCFVSRYIQECRYCFDGFRIRCIYFFHCQFCFITGFWLWCRARSDFNIRRIAAVVTEYYSIFTDFSQSGKFMCLTVTDGTAVCFNRTELQTAAVEYIGICLIHIPICFIQTFRITVKGI